MAVLAMIIIAGAVSQVRAADAPATPPEADFPKSVFEDRPDDLSSRDPFYPSSTRRRPAPVRPATPSSPNARPTPTTPPKPTSMASHLRLGAIYTTEVGRIAIINDQRFSPGQTRQVYAQPNLTLKVRCLEIDNKTVKVSVGDETEPQVLSLP